MPNDTRKVSQQRKPIRSIRGQRIETADWGSADKELLSRAIERATATGGAIRFGYSQDGGAYAIGIYYDGEMHTEFVRPSEDIDDFLEKVAEWYDDQAMMPKTDVNGKNKP